MEDLAEIIEDSLLTYSDDIIKRIDELGEDLARTAVIDLTMTSPARTKRYATSWTYRTTGRSKGEWVSFEIYNKDHFQLTHLLEKGHANFEGTLTDISGVVKHYTKPGRTPAHPHILETEKWIKRMFKERVYLSFNWNDGDGKKKRRERGRRR